MIFALAVPLLSAASSLAGTPPGGKLERGKLLYLLGCAGVMETRALGTDPTARSSIRLPLIYAVCCEGFGRTCRISSRP
jgi:hypothetical protein